MKRNAYHKQKLEERIRQDITTFLKKELHDPKMLLVSITKVELTNDQAHGKVYWDTFDNHQRGEIKKVFDSLSSRIRSYLADVLNVRHVPALQFFYDSQFESEQNISNILDQEKKRLGG